MGLQFQGKSKSEMIHKLQGNQELPRGVFGEAAEH